MSLTDVGTAFTEAATDLSDTIESFEDALFSMPTRKAVKFGEFEYLRIEKEWGFKRDGIQVGEWPLKWKIEIVELLPQFVKTMTGELEEETKALIEANAKAKLVLEGLGT